MEVSDFTLKFWSFNKRFTTVQSTISESRFQKKHGQSFKQNFSHHNCQTPLESWGKKVPFQSK